MVGPRSRHFPGYPVEEPRRLKDMATLPHRITKHLFWRASVVIGRSPHELLDLGGNGGCQLGAVGNRLAHGPVAERESIERRMLGEERLPRMLRDCSGAQ